MTKTGKGWLQLIWVIFLAGGLSVTASAQDISVEIDLSETKIFSGEQVRLELSISGTSMGSVTQPELPEIDGLRWLRGNTQRGTQYSLINGKPSVTYTFGYVLIAQDPGNYRVPAFDVSVDGTTYRTQALSFEVLDPATIDRGEADRSPDIYVRIEPSTKNPVVGEQVIADVVLYFKRGVEVSSYQPTPGWKAEGFWKEELEYPQRAQTSSSIINGVRYQRARLLQYALFPTKSGELTLSPFEITVAVRKQRSSRDPFGFGLGQERMNLQTIPVTINVDSPPPVDDANFIGAVGDFTITREVSVTEALVGESIEVTTTVRGRGNVPLVNKPEYEYPESLEQYSPEESSNISRTGSRISGTRTFKDVLIARNEGTFTIPAARLAFYDPSGDEYQIVELEELAIDVERDPNAEAITHNNLRLNVEPVTGLTAWHNAGSRPLYQKFWVWVFIVLPLLITAGVYGYKVYANRMETDVAFARSRTAADKAETTLKQADEASDIKEGYYLIEKALVQYITDKLNLPPAGLSHQQVIEEVKSHGDEGIAIELKRLLDKCETIAYAPNATQKTLDSDIQKTRDLIKKIGKLI
ncbi:BatD family protein [Gracilimonas mengyeensis]|uniref:Oxygen tolerance n=1 Tax=Gracilimonas mengyeensis TaxID=1302730 RepID=A0A521DCS8_9BACT|nr:BatD family protein [Gracilimonas mengyeensis]SMO69382.1 Oxygen tolerance [Gracilimonas mengyeensis]